MFLSLQSDILHALTALWPYIVGGPCLTVQESQGNEIIEKGCAPKTPPPPQTSAEETQSQRQ